MAELQIKFEDMEIEFLGKGIPSIEELEERINRDIAEGTMKIQVRYAKIRLKRKKKS